MEIRVLLVDDEKNLLEQAKLFLEKLCSKLKIETVQSAKRAYEILEKESYDVIISDYQMPEVNGLDFLEEIRKNDQDIPFIIFTGKGREEVAIEALNLGANRYIRKGGDPKSQYKVLAEVVKQEFYHAKTKDDLIENERKYRGFFKTARDCTFITSKDGEWKDFNNVAVEMFGYDSREELQKVNTRDLYADPEYRKKFTQIIEEKGYVEEMPVKLKKKDGTIFQTVITAVVYKNKKGNIIGYQGTIKDISNYEENKQSVEKYKNKYKNLFNKINDAVYIHDFKGNFIDANQKALDLFGYSKEDIKNLNITDILDEEQLLLAIETIEKIMHNENQEESTVYEINIDGKKDIFLETKASLLYEKGKPFAIQGIARDITKYKKMIEKYRKSESKYRKLTETAQDFIISHDINGKITFVNSHTCNATGYSKDELLCMKVSDLIHQDYHKSLCERKEKRLIGEGDLFVYETTILTKEDKSLLLEVKSSPIKINEDEIEILVVGRDISERKRVENELKKLKKAMESSIDGIAILDSESNYTYVNQAHADIYGYANPNELIGKSWKILYKKEEKERIRDEIFSILKEKGEWRGEAVGKKKNDEIFPQEISLNKIEGGGLICVVRDISKRKEIENKLREKEDKLRKLYEITPQIESIDTLDNIYDMTIETANKILNFDVCSIVVEERGQLYVKSSTEEELIDNISVSVNKGIAGKTYRNKKSYLIGDLKNLDEAEPTDENFSSAISIPIGNFGVFQAFSYQDDYYDVDDLELAELLVRHVSEVINRIKSEKALKISEERYRAVIESAFTGIGINDTYQVIVFVNETFANMLGYSQEEMVGMNLSEIMNQDEFKRMKERHERRKEGERDYYESILFHKNGQKLHTLISASPLKDAEDNYIGDLGVIFDITEKKKSEERETFLHSMLRHDLKNKMQITKGYLSLLSESNLSPEQAKFVKKALDGYREGQELIEKVRKLREIERTKTVKEVELENILNNAIDKIKNSLLDKGIKLELDGNFNVNILGNELLEELFFNLLENSMKHSKGDLIKVKIVDKEEVIMIIFEDNGVGIPYEIKEDIFEKGVKGKSSTGSGLGMYLIKKIIRECKGEIQHKKSDIGGSRFDITLKKPNKKIKKY